MEVQSSLNMATWRQPIPNRRHITFQRFQDALVTEELDPGLFRRHGSAGPGTPARIDQFIDVRQCISDDPARAGAAWPGEHVELAEPLVLLRLLAHLHRAIQDLEQATRLDPGNATYHLTLGRACQQGGYLHQARLNLEQAMRASTEEPEGTDRPHRQSPRTGACLRLAMEPVALEPAPAWWWRSLESRKSL